ncbi:hypothetical protein HAX54_012883 [Datura stramonium]|uniref:Uncharacterized protein n=1 Tax=Datura stramonium TaxID=4076 RepID=A0ABS8RXP8_DATST|nr:hypothetical protein [Datura stramonium]
MAEEKHHPEIEPEMDVDEGGEEEDDEVFYERIEAPNFICESQMQVGICDALSSQVMTQKHEEEMALEKIYKDFVLRVMAARSPNVRLQKALSRHAAGKNIKCPLTVPQNLPSLDSQMLITTTVGNDDPLSQSPSVEDHNGTEVVNTVEHSICFQTSEGAGHHHSECMDSDDKENVSVPNENRLTKSSWCAEDAKIVKKNAQPVAKNLKESLLSTNAGASGMKLKKPKPTNPKPFRLRTDSNGLRKGEFLGKLTYRGKNRCNQDYPEGNERDSKGLRNDLSVSVMYLEKESEITSNKTSEGKVIEEIQHNTRDLILHK